MTEYFEDLLAVLFDANRALNPARLSELSDPTKENLAAFRSAWFEAHSERRLEISRHLYDLAQNNIELLFERINLVLLDDPDPAVRQQAIDNLWESEGHYLARRLTELSREDPSFAVREAAVQALARFVYLAELDKLPRALRTDMEHALQEMLPADNPEALRRRALEALGYSSQIDIEELIREAYNSSEEEDVRSSLVAMGRSADPAWREEIEAHLNHPAPRIRAEAARAIGEIQSRKSVDRLLDLLDDPKDQVRYAAIWSLGQVGGQKARQALEQLAQDTDEELIQEAIEQALEHIAFLEATPDLLMFDLEDSSD
jgi:HEAT repeat protein